MHKRHQRGSLLNVISKWHVAVWAEWFRQQEALLQQSTHEVQCQLQVSRDNFCRCYTLQQTLRGRQITAAIRQHQRKVAARSLVIWRLLCQARAGKAALWSVERRLTGQRRRWIIAQHALIWRGVVRMGRYLRQVSESHANGYLAWVLKERVAGWRACIRTQKVVAALVERRRLAGMRDAIEALVAYACAAHIEQREAIHSQHSLLQLLRWVIDICLFVYYYITIVLT